VWRLVEELRPEGTEQAYPRFRFGSSPPGAMEMLIYGL